MRIYFITVRDHETPKAIDPGATLVRVLPPAPIYRRYCCRPSEDVGTLPEAYVYRVTVHSRREAERVTGVVKCRAREPERYPTGVCIEVC